MRSDGIDADELTAVLVADSFEVAGGVLHVGGQSLVDIVAAAGTPLFVYDAALLRQSYRRLAGSVAGFAEIYYSIKANPNPDIARIFVTEGAGLEIASAAEYERARAAGCQAGRIVFAGPGKTTEELEHVLRRGVGEIHVESEGEIARLAEIADNLGYRIEVAIRVNPVAEGQGGAMRMGGRPAPFGIDEERLLEAASLTEARPELALSGVHLFAGTQILDAEILGRQWAHGLDVARRLALHLGRPLATIDLGGGLGIPYFAGDRALDLERLRQIAGELAQQVRTDSWLSRSRIIIEPGRFLAGPGGLYVTRVLDVKESRGERFVVVDGGMHHHLAASGNLGQVIKRDYPVIAANRMADDRRRRAAVVGPLCTPLDTLARQAQLPDLRPGDLVAVLQSGAYGLTASPVGFLSHPMSAEVLIDDGECRIIRPRGTFEQPMTALP